MNKLLLAAAVALFMINSPAIGDEFEGSEGASIAEARMKPTVRCILVPNQGNNS
jgi:hypothetical protein